MTVASVYLGGSPLATGISSSVPIGASVKFSYSPSGSSYTAGAAYTLKVVSATGGVFAFSVIDGASS